MSWTMTHLILANEYRKQHPVEDAGLFLLANIAPDAVHARTDFNKELKTRSHYMQLGVKWGEIYTEKEMNDWYAKLGEFYAERLPLARTGQELAFLQGYTLHILADIFNCSILYGPMFLKYGHDVEGFRREYARENELWDRRLYFTYPDSRELLRILEIAAGESFPEELLEHLRLDAEMTTAHLKTLTDAYLNRYATAEETSAQGLEMIDDARSDLLIQTILQESKRLLFDFPNPAGCFAFREIE